MTLKAILLLQLITLIYIYMAQQLVSVSAY